MTKIRYIPFLELSLFLAVLILLAVAFAFKFNIWLILFSIPVMYLGILGNAYIIKLKNNQLIFSPLSPFLDAHLIEVSSIVKISSEQSYESESDITAEATFSVFNRRYRIEYIDRKNTKRTVLFAIHSRTKEQKIFAALKGISQ